MASLAGNGSADAKQFGLNDLLARAFNYHHTGDFEMARRFYCRCIELEPDNFDVQVVYGEFLAEVGDVEEAKQIFADVCARGRDAVNPSVMLSLAQLQSGKDAVATFEQGIVRLQQLLQAGNGDSGELKSRIASAYCRVAEVYMTDLCFEPNAEQVCEASAKKALEYGGADNIEALYCAASVSLSQCKKNSAKEYIIKAASVLERSAEMDQEEVNDFDITYDLQLNVAKTLIEVGEPSKANSILERLLLVNDTDIELLFVTGICYNAIQEFGTAKQYLVKSKDVINKLKNSGEDYGGMDLTSYLRQINHMLGEVDASANATKGAQ